MMKQLVCRGLISFLLCSIFLAAGCRRNSNVIQGYVEGEFVYVSSPQGGTLDRLAVSRGAHVQPGDLLFQLDPEPEQSALREAEAQLSQAQSRLADLKKGQRPEEIAAMEAQLEQAKAAFELAGIRLRRFEQLTQTKVSSREELDQAQSTFDQTKKRVAQLQAELEVARMGARADQVAAAEADVKRSQAAVARARWNLKQKTQKADVAAPVFDTLYRQGEFVPAGQPVVALLPPENVKVRAFVSETRLGALHIGDPVEFAVDGATDHIYGKIRFISQKAEYTPPVIYSRENRSKLVFLVEIGCEPKDAVNLHPGQPADVWLPGK